MKKGLLVAFTIIGLCSGLSPSTYLTPVDKDRLKLVLSPAWALSDLAQVLYASAGYKHLGLEIKNVEAVCNFVKGSTNDGSNVETWFLASSAGKALGCPLKASPSAKQTVGDAIREGASPQELFHAVTAARNLGIDFDSGKVLRATQLALKKDDSVLSLGYAFHVGSHLKGEVTSIYERIEDAIVQADEVDGQMLQFEGGLSITALVLSGAYRLAENSKKALPIKPDQAVKFANYLMSRKSVQLSKGVYYLLDAVSMLTTNKFHIPVAITLASNVAVSKDAPLMQVKVTDLMGSSLQNLKVVAESATAKNNDVVIISKENLVAKASDKSVYELDVMSRKPARGFYNLVLSATGGDPRLVGHTAASLTFKVLTAISVEDIEFGTIDNDQSSPPSLNKINFPTKLEMVIEADQHQKILLKFVVKDTVSNRPTRVHQAFVKFTHIESKREVIFIAEPDQQNLYKFDLDVSSSSKVFGSINGKYAIELIVGDASISNPSLWPLADIELNFPDGVSGSPSQEHVYKARPEIQHTFRKPDSRPPSIVATTFTALCVVPLLVLVIIWMKLGVNVSNFSISLGSIGFHLGLGAIFCTFCLFWLQLNMFTTLRYLLGIGIITFFCGNNMLATIAAKRKEQEVKMVYGSYYQKSFRFSQPT